MNRLKKQSSRSRAITQLVCGILIAINITGGTAATMAEDQPNEMKTNAPDAVAAPDGEPAYSKYLQDPAGYQWKLNRNSPFDHDTTFYDVTLTSQIWHGATWTHPVQVFVPKNNIAPDIALIFVQTVPNGIPSIAQMAADTGVTCVLTGGMYQACFGVQGGEGIAIYGTQQYLKTGDSTWMVTAAVVKSLIRTMDAVEELSKKEMGAPIQRFILTGHSKMGMASWQTAITDPRVKGIIPIGADLLNVNAQPKTLAIMQRVLGNLQSNAGKQLLALFDPYSFRLKLTAPKLIISGADDETYDLNAVNQYWDGLPGLKWHLYLDNASHAMEVGNPKLFRGIAAFTKAIALNKELPKIDWKFTEANGRLQARATTSVPAKSARLWSAAGPFGINSKWSEQPMTAGDGNMTYSGEVPIPPTGAAAYSELEFEQDGGSYSLYCGLHYQAVKIARTETLRKSRFPAIRGSLASLAGVFLIAAEMTVCNAHGQTLAGQTPPGAQPPAGADANTVMFNLMKQLGLNPNATMKDCVVLLTAQAQATPPLITLNWKAVPKNTGFTVTRRDKDGAVWTALATLQPGAVSYADNTVLVGKEYEYKVATTVPAIPLGQITAMMPGFGGKLQQARDVGFDFPESEFGKLYGYVLSGIEVPVKDLRGKVVLLVDESQASPLAREIERLQSDLIGDGWGVIRHDVKATEPIAAIRELVRKDYQSDPANVKSVFILGHIPVPYSGNYTPDGHFQRVGAQPADVFYASIDGVWTDSTVNTVVEEKKRPAGMQSTLPEDVNVPGDGRFDQSEIPGKIWLQIGRVDFADMPAFAPLTDTDLLRRYLDKDHAFRHKAYTVAPGCLVEDDLNTTAPLGYSFCMAPAHTCTPMFGAGKIILTKGNWLKTLCDGGSQWAFAFAGSEFDHCGGIVATKQLVDADPKVVFTGMWGSFFGYWPAKNDLMRAMIATRTYTLTCVYAGSPPVNLHAMSLGETAGYGVWYSQHPDVCPGACAGRVHTELMGDPTLRMHIVAPAKELSAMMTNRGTRLSWKASDDSGVLGYHVYRAIRAGEPFVRLTKAPVAGTTFTDQEAAAGKATYMVRAVKLETSASGSYYNASQGIFAGPPVAG